MLDHCLMEFQKNDIKINLGTDSFSLTIVKLDAISIYKRTLQFDMSCLVFLISEFGYSLKMQHISLIRKLCWC